MLRAEVVEDQEQGPGIQSPEDFVQIADFLHVQDIDHDAPLGQEGDEALGLELEQGVPQRRAAQVQALHELGHGHEHARGQAFLADLLAQVLVDLGTEKLSGRLEESHAWGSFTAESQPRSSRTSRKGPRSWRPSAGRPRSS